MADLGSIDFRIPTEGGIDGSQAELQAIAGVANAVIEDKKEDILLGFKGEAEDIVDDISIDDPAGELVLPQGTGDPAADAFRANMIRLRAAALQGNSSQRARAELELKRHLNTSSNMFPGLRQEFSAEMNRFTTGSAALDELQLRDMDTAQYSKEAVANRKVIVDHATQNWSAGGLGMDPALDPTSQAFATEYLFKAGQRAGVELSNMLIEASNADAALTAEGVEQNWQRAMVGDTNIVFDMIAEQVEMANAVAAAATGAGISDPALFDRVADWQNGGKETALRAIEDQMIKLDTMFIEENSKLQGTAAFKRVEKLKDDALDSMNRMVTAIRDDNYDVIKLWNVEQTIRGAKIRNSDANLDSMLSFLEVLGPAMPFLETLGGEHIGLKDQLGFGLTQGVESFISTGLIPALQSEPQATDDPDKLRLKLSGARSANTTGAYQVPTSDPVLAKQAAVAWVQELQSQFEPLIGHSDPKTVGAFALSAVDKIDTLSEQGGTEPDVVEAMKSFAGAQSFRDAIVVMKQDPALTNQITALGQSLFDYIDTVGVDEWQAESTELITGRSGEALTFPMLEIDLSRILGGEVSFSVNPSKLELVQFRPGSQESRRKTILEQAERDAARLSELATRDVKIWAGMQDARNPSGEIDYIDAYGDLILQGYYPLPPDTEIL